MSAAAEEVEVPRVYTHEEGARLIDPGGKIVRPSTLARLARNHLVPCTRNGRKSGWTAAQLVGVVAHLATANQSPESSAPPAEKRKREASPPPKRGAIAPLESRPGRRYSQAH
ncbi:hypothetical protein [Herbidospora sp. RD11066]